MRDESDVSPLNMPLEALDLMTDQVSGGMRPQLADTGEVLISILFAAQVTSPIVREIRPLDFEDYSA